MNNPLLAADKAGQSCFLVRINFTFINHYLGRNFVYKDTILVDESGEFLENKGVLL